MTAGPLHFSVTSAHAPYNDKSSPVNLVPDWWIDFSKQYKIVADRFNNRICGIDTNQKHGNINLESQNYLSLFGSVGRSSPHPNFLQFLDFCHDFQELPISTISSYCDNEFTSNPYTYIHKQSWEVSMIDYLLTSGNIQIQPKTCSRWEDIVLSCLCDHIPIGAMFAFSPTQNTEFHKRRKLTYNPKLIGNPLNDSVFIQLSYNIIQPVFNMDTTSHCWLLEEQIKHCLNLVYPVSSLPSKKNKYLFEFTFNIIVQHRKSTSGVLSLSQPYFQQQTSYFLGLWNLGRQFLSHP